MDIGDDFELSEDEIRKVFGFAIDRSRWHLRPKLEFAREYFTNPHFRCGLGERVRRCLDSEREVQAAAQLADRTAWITAGKQANQEIDDMAWFIETETFAGPLIPGSS